jgi:uncharacterized Tic20 family protein
MKKYFKITEYVWLVLSLIMVITSVYLFIIGDQQTGTFSLLLTAFAGVMYSMRLRYNRMVERQAEKAAQMESQSADKQSNKKG